MQLKQVSVKGLKPVVIGLVIGLCISLGFVGVSYGKLQSQKTQCEDILKQVQVEYDLHTDFCNYTLQDLAWTDVLSQTPYSKLARVQNYRQDLAKRSAQNQQQINADLQKKISEFKIKATALDKVLVNKIEQAKKFNINTDSYTPTEQNLVKLEFTSSKNAQMYLDLEKQIAKDLDSLDAQIAERDLDLIAKYTVNFPILTYHRIENYAILPKNLKSSARREITVSPETFGKQLDFILQKGYKTVNLEDIQQAVDSKNAEFFKQKLVMLTFDDGYSEHYKLVFPELKKRNMKGVFAIVTDFRGIEWSQLQEMSAQGMEIVSHCPLASNTKNSHDLNPIGGEYKACNGKYGGNNQLMPTAELKYELVESKKALKTNLGKPVNYLIYPYGSYNQQVVDIARDSGYKIALCVGSGPTINLGNALTLGRVNVSGFQDTFEGWFAIPD